ncbi:hypothetical protein ABPG74_015036 [Tetrahymena malaccensis]
MELSQNYQNYHYILEPDDFLALKNETRCAICLDIFEDPVTTFCQHTYCKKCLENHIRSNGAKQAFCPLCKMPVGKRNYIPDKKAQVLASIILNIKPIKKIQITETPKKDLLSTRKRKASELHQPLKTYEISSNQIQSVQKNENSIISSSNNNSKPKTRKRNDKINILVSNMPEEFQHEVDKFCKLYKAKQFKDYHEQLTHLVVFPIDQKDDKIIAKRTLKYLSALVEGIWIVGFNWIIHSNGYNELKDEEEFEVYGDPYGINTPRESRLRNGLTDLLENLIFYISEKQTKKDQQISKKELSQLIKLAGGNVIENNKDEPEEYFHVLITSGQQNIDKNSIKSLKSSSNDGQIVVSHKWLLDSISKGQLLNYKNYT